MTPYGIIFYILAAIIVVATVLAVTRRHPVHAIVCLVGSFIASALLFYLLGAPLLAAFEVIIYAGAVMVLFLFVVMMLKLKEGELAGFPFKQWAPAGLLGVVFLAVTALVAFTDPHSKIGLETAIATPGAFGRIVFEKYWFPVEVISLLLLVALVGAIVLGRDKAGEHDGHDSGGVVS